MKISGTPEDPMKVEFDTDEEKAQWVRILFGEEYVIVETEDHLKQVIPEPVLNRIRDAAVQDYITSGGHARSEEGLEAIKGIRGPVHFTPNEGIEQPDWAGFVKVSPLIWRIPPGHASRQRICTIAGCKRRALFVFDAGGSGDLYFCYRHGQPDPEDRL